MKPITADLIARELFGLAVEAERRAEAVADGGYAEGPSALDYLNSARQSLVEAAKVLAEAVPELPEDEDDDDEPEAEPEAV